MKASQRIIAYALEFLFLLLIFSSKSIFAADITSTWFSTTALPYFDASLVSFSFGGKPYALGGSAITGQSHNQIISSTPDINGQLGLWSTEAVFPTAPIWHAIARKDNNVYILGGKEENLGSANNFVNKVYLGRLDQTGVTTWVQLNSLPNNLGMGAAAIAGDRIYFSGGFNFSGFSNKIYSAPINPDGSLGAWTVSGDIPEGMYGHSMVSYNGNLIILGGYDIIFLNQVYRATPAADGTISSWQPTTTLPTPNYRSSAIVLGSQLYMIGGTDQLSTTTNIYFADLASDGSVGPWTLSQNHLPSPVHGAGLAQVGDYLYLMGGYDSNTEKYLNSVYYTKLNSGETTLNVPLLKQTDPVWRNLLYDSANQWFPSDPSIGRWGCALTSAAMVLQYHGINKMPDGSTLNPKTLNSWLTNQPGGYLHGGAVNWIVLGKLVKDAKAQNPQFTYDTLEYLPTVGYNPQLIENNLLNNKPVILAEPGHFIVAKGISGNTFTINDPGFSRSSLQDYGNTAIAMGTYIPANSDLSYIELIVDEGVTISVTDSNGNPVSVISYTQPPIRELNGDALSGSPQSYYYIPKPESDVYTIKLSSDSKISYTLQTSILDRGGNIYYSELKGIVGNDASDIFNLFFNKENSAVSAVAQDYSFDSLIADINMLYENGLIINKGIYNSMIVRAQQAKDLSQKSTISADAIINSLLSDLEEQQGKAIEDEAYQILKPELEFLYNQLK